MRYLLSICILFFSGLGSVAGSGNTDAILSSISVSTIQSNFIRQIQPGDSNFHTSGPEQRNTNDPANVAEVQSEEDEVHFSKKYLHNNSSYILIFESSAAYFFHFLKHRISIGNQPAFQVSGDSLTIAFGVFRL